MLQTRATYSSLTTVPPDQSWRDTQNFRALLTQMLLDVIPVLSKLSEISSKSSSPPLFVRVVRLAWSSYGFGMVMLISLAQSGANRVMFQSRDLPMRYVKVISSVAPSMKFVVVFWYLRAQLPNCAEVDDARSAVARQIELKIEESMMDVSVGWGWKDEGDDTRRLLLAK